MSRSRLDSSTNLESPAKINTKAVDKFIHRQELARWLKKEKEIYEEKLRKGVIINNKGMKEIDEQK